MEELTRRTALQLAAGAVAALGSASCAASAAPDNPSDASGSPRRSTASTPSLRELATVAAIPDGGVVEVTAAAGQPAYPLRSGASSRLLSATCTHARCQVHGKRAAGSFSALAIRAGTTSRGRLSAVRRPGDSTI